MNKKILIVLGFDMETDIGSWSPYYRGLLEGTPLLLNLLSRKKINATFFFTGESAKLYPEICKDVFKNGHEIGCHGLYHETMGDPIFDIPNLKPLLPIEIKERIKVATNYIIKAININPTSFRCPRLWGSTSTVVALEELGYIADASYPMYFYENQLVPYHPSRYNWIEKGDMHIIEIPNFADITISSNNQSKRDRDQWPLFRIEGAEALMNHINNFINYTQKKEIETVLCFYFHPWEFIEMPKKLHYGEATIIPDNFIIKNCGDYALNQFEKLLDFLTAKEVEFINSKKLATDFEW